MAYVKYTREVLSEAVAAATTMSGVLRRLGLKQNGGAHAHLRRRIHQLGIDTSHFLGRAHARGVPSARRRTPAEVLVMRPEEARRAAPATLTRALVQLGRSHRCEHCGVGAVWNGRPLTLHVDHIDGRCWDCRAENLRFLCPNCHSQTATYAGRNRPVSRYAVVRVDEHGDPVAAGAPGSLSDQERRAVLARARGGELTVSDAARLLGCHRNHVYQLQRRLAERGTFAPAAPRPRTSAVDRDAVVAFALGNPTLGARRLSEQLRRRPRDPVMVAPGTVANILRQANLSTRAARLEARAKVD